MRSDGNPIVVVNVNFVFQVLAKRSTDDFVICPFCLSSTLAMLSMGATGNTLEELRSGAGISRNLSSFESIKSSIQSYKVITLKCFPVDAYRYSV